MGTCSVLVVEDDPTIRESIWALLELEGYRVIRAGNGAQALTEIEREWPDLVLLDLKLPVMDGQHFAAEVARRGWKLPIIVMTGDPDAHRWQHALQAAGYLRKPFEFDDLLTLIERACAGRQILPDAPSTAAFR